MTRRERQLPRDILVLWEPILTFTDTNTVLFERCIQLLNGDEFLVITIDDSSSSSDTFLLPVTETVVRRGNVEGFERLEDEVNEYLAEITRLRENTVSGEAF